MLKVFFVGQRKALLRSVEILAMHPDEEPEVRRWLKTRWDHMHKLWAPISHMPVVQMRPKRKASPKRSDAR